MPVYHVKCYETVHFTVAIEAENETQAETLAHADINSHEVIAESTTEWDIEEVILESEEWYIKQGGRLNCFINEYATIMTRKEYELVFQAFKNYRLYMTDEQEVLSEKILDDLFYPEFDKLASDDLKETVAAAEEALADEPEINGVRSLNFRSNSFGKI